MIPNTLKDDATEILQDALKATNNVSQMPIDELKRFVQALEDFECWQPCISLLNSWLKTHSDQPTIRARLAKICIYHQARVNEAARMLADFATKSSVSFEQLERLILTEVLEAEDFSSQAFLLENVWQSLAEQRDRVKCLERMCLLYEKKVHDEDKLFEYNTKLLKVDPTNHRALRYFKIISAQSGDWPAVENYLARLVSSATHPKDVYRIAQELAAVQLYQLDKPSESLATIRKFCTESHLDTSTIEYDAYQRLSDWRGCSAVLRRLIDSVKTNQERSILNLKIGIIEEASNNQGEAFQRYVDAFEFDGENIEAMERLIQLMIKKRDWSSVASYLKRLIPIIKTQELHQRLREAIERVDGVLN